MKSIRALILLFLIGNAATATAQKDSIMVTVYFDFDKYHLTQHWKDHLMYTLKPFETVDSLAIVGHTDFVGGYKYNDGLSLRRANRVKDFLLDAKFKGKIDVGLQGKGKYKLAVNRQDSAWQNRRVTVIAYVTPEPEVPVVQPQPQPDPVKPPVDTVPVTPVVPKPTDPVKTVDTVRVPQLINTEGSKEELERRLTELFKKLKPGSSIVLSTLYFEEGRHTFAKGAYDVLEAAVKALKNNPTVEVELQGHVCCADPVASDLVDLDTKEFKLSHNRSRAVLEYLVKNGIDAKRLTYTSFGARRRLVYPERTSDDAARNRRVEFVIIKQ
ncbi:OmpA family protein [Foetidibacter luteolus]|uniref:OmpA family protein n=1 Tax=Foetidibacter luteolus TaxID=2608880 RepID=UPI00129AB5F8|nr:OmpA family protein [Foetidibacter luteolus]